MNPKPAIILVSPQMGENIGASARAMLNFGLTDMRIVNPRDGWPNQRAIDMSADALDKMPPVQVFETLAEAIADLQVTYATTARPRDMVKSVLTPRAAADDIHSRTDQKIGLVFGGERAGLTNDEIALCSHIIQVPTNPDFSSLNLAQAVLLLSYEIFQTASSTEPCVFDTGDNAPATQENFEHFFGRLEDELEKADFFKSEGLKPTMLRNIRNIFTRAELSEQEVSTLQGIISALIDKKSG